MSIYKKVIRCLTEATNKVYAFLAKSDKIIYKRPNGYCYGIGGKTLKWINALLCYRQQRVFVKGVKSDCAPVVTGVPPGTVLADDCVCYRAVKNIEDTLKLPRDIDRLGNWARKWGMGFQPAT